MINCDFKIEKDFKNFQMVCVSSSISFWFNSSRQDTATNKQQCIKEILLIKSKGLDRSIKFKGLDRSH